MARTIDVKLIKRGCLMVAVPVRKLPALTRREVARTLAALRRRGMPLTLSVPGRIERGFNRG